MTSEPEESSRALLNGQERGVRPTRGKRGCLFRQLSTDLWSHRGSGDAAIEWQPSHMEGQGHDRARFIARGLGGHDRPWNGTTKTQRVNRGVMSVTERLAKALPGQGDIVHYDRQLRTKHVPKAGGSTCHEYSQTRSR